MKAILRFLKALGIVIGCIIAYVSSVALLSALCSLVPGIEPVVIISIVAALLITASLFGYVAIAYQWLRERECRRDEEVER